MADVRGPGLTTCNKETPTSLRTPTCRNPYPQRPSCNPSWLDFGGRWGVRRGYRRSIRVAIDRRLRGGGAGWAKDEVSGAGRMRVRQRRSLFAHEMEFPTSVAISRFSYTVQ